MERVRWRVLLVAAVLLLSGCVRGAPETESLQQKAGEITDLIARNAWSDVREDFDATMRAGLSEDQLATAWRQVTQQQGAYRSRREPTPVPKPGDLVVFDTPMVFERGEMKSRVTFRENGEIAGLFILVPSVP